MTDDGPLVPDSLVPLLARAARVVGRLVWTTARLAFVAAVLVAMVVLDRRRRRRVRRWFLLEGDRWVIIGGMVLAVLVGSILLSMTNVIGFVEAGFVTTMFSTIIAGLFSFVPILIGVNQLTISQLFGTPETLRERIESVQALRERIEDLVTEVPVTPTDPGAFLALAAGVLAARATALREAVADSGDPKLIADVSEYVETIHEQTDELEGRLDGGDHYLLDVLLPMMGDGYSANVNAARRLEVRYADSLSEPARSLFADVRELSVTMDVIRQYYKALYIQQELANLSRLIAYTGVGAFLLSMFLVMLFANGSSPAGPGLPRVLLVSVSLAVVTSPFAVLFAFVVRIATIVKRTAAPGAFTPRGETPDDIQ